MVRVWCFRFKLTDNMETQCVHCNCLCAPETIRNEHVQIVRLIHCTPTHTVTPSLSHSVPVRWVSFSQRDLTTGHIANASIWNSSWTGALRVEPSSSFDNSTISSFSSRNVDAASFDSIVDALCCSHSHSISVSATYPVQSCDVATCPPNNLYDHHHWNDTHLRLVTHRHPLAY